MNANNANANALKRKLNTSVRRVVNPVSGAREAPAIIGTILALRKRNANAKSLAQNATLNQILEMYGKSRNSNADSLELLYGKLLRHGINSRGRPIVQNNSSDLLKRGGPLYVKVGNVARPVRPAKVAELKKLFENKRSSTNMSRASANASGLAQGNALNGLFTNASTRSYIKGVLNMKDVPAAEKANILMRYKEGPAFGRAARRVSSNLPPNVRNVVNKMKNAPSDELQTNMGNQSRKLNDEYGWLISLMQPTGDTSNENLEKRILRNARVMNLKSNVTASTYVKGLINKAIGFRNQALHNIKNGILNPPTGMFSKKSNSSTAGDLRDMYPLSEHLFSGINVSALTPAQKATYNRVREEMPPNNNNNTKERNKEELSMKQFVHFMAIPRSGRNRNNKKYPNAMLANNRIVLRTMLQGPAAKMVNKVKNQGFVNNATRALLTNVLQRAAGVPNTGGLPASTRSSNNEARQRRLINAVRNVPAPNVNTNNTVNRLIREYGNENLWHGINWKALTSNTVNLRLTQNRMNLVNKVRARLIQTARNGIISSIKSEEFVAKPDPTNETITESVKNAYSRKIEAAARKIANAYKRPENWYGFKNSNITWSTNSAKANFEKAIFLKAKLSVTSPLRTRGNNNRRRV